VCIVVVCFVIVKPIGVFVMETLCSHVLICYDLLASTIYSKKELQSFSSFVLVKLFEYFSLSNLENVHFIVYC
jgi:hypothetical protein